jgi:hypothetical protein
MAGKKGRSGPPGHLRGCKHPWKLLWRRKLITPQCRWVTQFIETYISDLRADKPDLTAGEQRTLEIAQLARGVTLLIFAECAQHGLLRKVNGDWDLQPAAHALNRFLAVELKALKLLGLDRRAKPIKKLTELLAAVPHACEDRQANG